MLLARPLRNWSRRLTIALGAFAALFAMAPSSAEDFQLIVTVTPPGSITNPANWQETLRFSVAGTGGSVTTLPSIPKTQVFDPAGIAFRSARELYVGNRHGNQLGLGSVSRFTLSEDGQTVAYDGNFTTPGLVGAHELDFNHKTGELFVAAVYNGIYRFKFVNGEPVSNGSFALGTGFRGICIHPSGRRLYATSASNVIRQYRLHEDGSVTELDGVYPPGASSLHFFALHPDGELYVSDIYAHKVYRYSFDSDDSLIYRGYVGSSYAVDSAFSPDGLEMFVGNHITGGITRFAYVPATDSWTPTGSISTPSMGGFGTYVPPPKLVSGRVELGDYVGDVTAQPVAFEFRDPGTGLVVGTKVVSLLADGSFVLQTSLAGTYNLAAKGTHWLTQVLRNVHIGDGVSGLEYRLVNGDVDNDDAVTVFDYNALSDAFDTGPGDPGWNANADLDGDGSVTVFDYNILSANFDLTGES